MTDLYHIESEQSVLGGLLIDPKAFERIDWLKEADFYREEHQLIYRHICLLLQERQPVDVVTVAESLVSAGVDESYVGLSYLGDLSMNTPSAANILRYAESVADKRLLRDLMVASSQIADLAQREKTLPISERIEQAQAVVYALGERRTENQHEPRNICSILSDVVADIEERRDRGGDISGLPTGFPDLDNKTYGLHPSDLIIIAGRPAMGKTTFALNIAEHVAVHENKGVLVFSMEMGDKQISERSISSIGTLSLDKIRTGKLDDNDYDRMTVAIGKLHKAPIYIDDTPALSVAKMRSRARRMIRKNGIALIVVDYIQLMTGKGESREQEVSSISRGLKAIAKEFSVPVIALSQLSRKVEERSDKRPMMSDLRDSGAIEQDADVILMMYRDEYYRPHTPDKGIAEIILSKQRMGVQGVSVMALFQGEYSRFLPLTEEAKQDVYRNREDGKNAAHLENHKFARRGKGLN